MGDLIERLRNNAKAVFLIDNERSDLIAAADELARLRAEVAELNLQIRTDQALIKGLRAREQRCRHIRDELRRKIAEAERFDAAMLLALGIPVSQDDAFSTFALVRLDAEEAK